jgi:hypothetical protein
MSSFAYEALPTRVRFGSGTVAALEEEVAALGLPPSTDPVLTRTGSDG